MEVQILYLPLDLGTCPPESSSNAAGIIWQHLAASPVANGCLLHLKYAADQRHHFVALLFPLPDQQGFAVPRNIFDAQPGDLRKTHGRASSEVGDIGNRDGLPGVTVKIRQHGSQLGRKRGSCSLARSGGEAGSGQSGSPLVCQIVVQVAREGYAASAVFPPLRHEGVQISRAKPMNGDVVPHFLQAVEVEACCFSGLVHICHVAVDQVGNENGTRCADSAG